VILEVSREIEAKLLILNGGQRRDRTADAGLFRAGFVPVTRHIARFQLVASCRSDGLRSLQNDSKALAIQKRLK